MSMIHLKYQDNLVGKFNSKMMKKQCLGTMKLEGLYIELIT